MKTFRSLLWCLAIALCVPSAGAATLARVFKLIDSQGQTSLLSARNAGVLLRPASTMKLFTAWFALSLGTQDDAYLSEMLRMSDNGMAEAALRAGGGTTALQEFLQEEGLAPTRANFRPMDGSGLSKSNKTTCDFEVALLERIRQSPDYERFRDLLAQPGGEGTLETRLLPLQGRLFAKTGTLNGTIALTGFLESPAGTVLFCLISQDFRGTWGTERGRLDGILLEQATALETAFSL